MDKYRCIQNNSLQIELYENKLNFAVKCLITVLQLVTFYYLQYYLQVGEAFPSFINDILNLYMKMVCVFPPRIC